MDNSKNRHTDHHQLGVNKLGKNIRKSPLHQPNLNNNNQNSNNQAARQQPQPQVYNISKNDFRNIVQQLTGSPSRDPAPPPPPPPNQNNSSPKPQSVRLQRIRPPPLTPIHRPGPPQFGQNPFSRPGPGPSLFGQPPIQHPNFAPAESPITAYMNYLQNSILADPSPRGAQHPAVPQNPPAGLLPLPSPPPPQQQFLLPSPTGYFGLLSPRSPYPPGMMMQFPPLTPNFGFGQMGGSGILGPGPSPNQAPPPLSPGLLFPLSPSGFFPISSPRWRDQ